jgi:hypothetical protein
LLKTKTKHDGSGGIRTHAPEETGALNQRLRPLGHATLVEVEVSVTRVKQSQNWAEETEKIYRRQ